MSTSRSRERIGVNYSDQDIFINKLKRCVTSLPALIHLNVKHEHTNLDYIFKHMNGGIRNTEHTSYRLTY